MGTNHQQRYDTSHKGRPGCAGGTGIKCLCLAVAARRTGAQKCTGAHTGPFQDAFLDAADVWMERTETAWFGPNSSGSQNESTTEPHGAQNLSHKPQWTKSMLRAQKDQIPPLFFYLPQTQIFVVEII